MNDDLFIDLVIEPLVDRFIHCAIGPIDCVIDVAIDAPMLPLMYRRTDEHIAQSMIRSSIID
jgi:hypothetical protein